MIDLFEDFLADRGDSPALIYGRRVFSSRELRHHVEATAEKLLGSAEKRLVFCFLPNGLDLVSAYLAAVTGGHAVGLFPPGTPVERKRRLVDSYRPEVVLADDREFVEWLRETGYRPSSRSGDDGRCLAVRRESAGKLAPELSLLLSTSGSTGTPKLVRLSAANLAANAKAIAASLSISPSQRAVTSLPLCYSYGLSILGSHLVAGAAVAVTELSPMTPAFWRFAQWHGVVEVGGTPLLYHALFGRSASPALPPSVRVLTQAGGRLSTSLARSALSWMTATDGRFYRMYGQTEATSRISCLDPSLLADKLDSVGMPLAGGQVEVGPPLPGTDGGPISYRGPNVMLGYATCREDLSRGREVDVLETGDLGRLDAEGCLYVTGRSSRYTKILDRRISLDDVEEWFDPPSALAAVAAPHQTVSEATAAKAAIVVYTTGEVEAMDGARRALTAALEIPSSAVELRSVEAIPRTDSGKVDYARLERAARTEQRMGQP